MSKSLCYLNLITGFVQPGVVQPGAMQPGVMQPGFMQPGFMQPGFMQPGVQPAAQSGLWPQVFLSPAGLMPQLPMGMISQQGAGIS